MNIEARFFEMGNRIFPVSLDQYRSESAVRIVGLLIDDEQRAFSELFGAIGSEDLGVINTEFATSRAGFCYNANSVFPSLSSRTDIFLINRNFLELSEEEIDGLILHELCHWYKNSGLNDRSPVAIRDQAFELGQDIYGRTDQFNEGMTEHTLDFCFLIAEAACRASELGIVQQEPGEFLLSMMQWDIQD